MRDLSRDVRMYVRTNGTPHITKFRKILKCADARAQTPSVFVHCNYTSSIHTRKQFAFAQLLPHQCCTSWDFDLGVNNKRKMKVEISHMHKRISNFYGQSTGRPYFPERNGPE